MPDVMIQRQTRRTRYFTEELGNGIDIDMVLIRGGTFLMGEPADAPDYDSTDRPQQEVTVWTFYMGR